MKSFQVETPLNDIKEGTQRNLLIQLKNKVQTENKEKNMVVFQNNLEKEPSMCSSRGLLAATRIISSKKRP